MDEKVQRIVAEEDAVAKRKKRDDVERKKILQQIRGDKLERKVRDFFNHDIVVSYFHAA